MDTYFPEGQAKLAEEKTPRRATGWEEPWHGWMIIILKCVLTSPEFLSEQDEESPEKIGRKQFLRHKNLLWSFSPIIVSFPFSFQNCLLVWAPACSASPCCRTSRQEPPPEKLQLQTRDQEPGSRPTGTKGATPRCWD